VFLAPAGMVAACDVRGGAAGTRELEVLEPGHVVDRIHGLMLSGGSAFGLDAAAGAVRWLEERGIGFDTGVARVPIVPAAILFDLAIGDPKRRPDAAMGYAAASAATEGPVAEGNVGAGTGATVGKIRGMALAMKAGVGCWTEACAGAQGQSVHVAALAAVNALGDVRNPSTGYVVAGACKDAASVDFLDTAAALRQGIAPESFIQPSVPPNNTVLVAVATDAALTRQEARRVAVMASAGMARALSPAFTRFDGDIVFALSCGDRRAAVEAIGSAAAEAVAEAIVRSATQARSAGGLPGLAG